MMHHSSLMHHTSLNLFIIWISFFLYKLSFKEWNFINGNTYRSSKDHEIGPSNEIQMIKIVSLKNDPRKLHGAPFSGRAKNILKVKHLQRKENLLFSRWFSRSFVHYSTLLLFSFIKECVPGSTALRGSSAATTVNILISPGWIVDLSRYRKLTLISILENFRTL